MGVDEAAREIVKAEEEAQAAAVLAAAEEVARAEAILAAAEAAATAAAEELAKARAEAVVEAEEKAAVAKVEAAKDKHEVARKQAGYEEAAKAAEREKWLELIDGLQDLLTLLMNKPDKRNKRKDKARMLDEDVWRTFIDAALDLAGGYDVQRPLARLQGLEEALKNAQAHDDLRRLARELVGT